MNLAMAISVAQHHVNPNWKYSNPNNGVYLSNNGQYMTGPRTSLPFLSAKKQWTWEQFLHQHANDRKAP